MPKGLWGTLLFLSLCACSANREKQLENFRLSRPLVVQKLDSLTSLNGYCLATLQAIRQDSAFVCEFIPEGRKKVDSLIIESRSQVFTSQKLRGEAMHFMAMFDSLDTYAELAIRDEEKNFPDLDSNLPKLLSKIQQLKDSGQELQMANKSTRSLFTYYRGAAMLKFNEPIRP